MTADSTTEVDVGIAVDAILDRSCEISIQCHGAAFRYRLAIKSKQLRYANVLDAQELWGGGALAE